MVVVLVLVVIVVVVVVLVVVVVVVVVMIQAAVVIVANFWPGLLTINGGQYKLGASADKYESGARRGALGREPGLAPRSKQRLRGPWNTKNSNKCGILQH